MNKAMKHWYVVQVYTGFEEVVKAELEKRIAEGDCGDFFGEILVPKGDVVSGFFDGEVKKEKIFPGYLLVQMEMNGDSFRIISSIPRVSRFLGGKEPMPLSKKEVERIFSQISGKLPVGKEEVPFSEGSEVHIGSGPFTGFIGIIEKIDEPREKLTVMVSIFGRLTPVELSFNQVKK